MPDLADGESIEMQGSGKDPYVLRNTGGVYSCTCPAWRNQSLAIEKRTCKHLRKLRGDAAEAERVGNAVPVRQTSGGDETDEPKGPPLLLAHVWENDVDLAGWWMSEKLDGVRAYWDGQKLISRLGNELCAPDWFVAGLPQTPLDGELWLERKAFQRTVSIVRRQDRSDHWKQIRYVVFDAPSLEEPFEARIKFVSESLTDAKSEYVEAHVQERCRDLEHLREELERVEALGGEGLMLRQPGSRYEAGRSTTLLKVKTFHDADAVVVEHVAGKGRHKGRLGALVVRLADGTEFSVGTGFSDRERENPPAPGSTISFRYQELSTAGVPRFPSFVRLRKDVASAAPAARRSKASAVAKPEDPAGEKTKVRIESARASAHGGTAASAAEGGRYFEFVGGGSSKFWEITQTGNEVTVRFGRIGSAGQTKTKSFADSDGAREHAEGLIAEKTGKGYVEQARP